MKQLTFVIALLVISASAVARIPAGTWVRQDVIPHVGTMIMLVEPAGSGIKLTYRIKGLDGTTSPMVMTIVSQLDGKEASVLVDGKPTGETMAITQVDANHTRTILKMDGKPFGTSVAELSKDGKVLKVENEITFAAYNRQVGKTTETWVKQ